MGGTETDQRTSGIGRIRWPLAVVAYGCMIWGMVAQSVYAYVTGNTNWVRAMIFGTFLVVV